MHPLRTELLITIELLQTDLAHPWTAYELAGGVHLSPSRLRGLFVDRARITASLLDCHVMAVRLQRCRGDQATRSRPR